MDLNGDKLWAVDKIIDSGRDENGGFRYRIQWKGFEDNNISWEPLENVINARKSVLKYEKRCAKAEKPSRAEIINAKRTANSLQKRA